MLSITINCHFPNDETHFELFFDGLVKRLQLGRASVWDNRQAGVALWGNIWNTQQRRKVKHYNHQARVALVQAAFNTLDFHIFFSYFHFPPFWRNVWQRQWAPVARVSGWFVQCGPGRSRRAGSLELGHAWTKPDIHFYQTWPLIFIQISLYWLLSGWSTTL